MMKTILNAEYGPAILICSYLNVKTCTTVVCLICKKFNESSTLSLSGRNIAFTELFSQKEFPGNSLLSKLLKNKAIGGMNKNEWEKLFQYIVNKADCKCLELLLSEKYTTLSGDELVDLIKFDRFFGLLKVIERECETCVKNILGAMKRLNISWDLRTRFHFYHPVFISTRHNNEKIVQILFDEGFQEEEGYWNRHFLLSLYTACEKGNTVIVKTILSKSKVTKELNLEGCDEEEEKEIESFYAINPDDYEFVDVVSDDDDDVIEEVTQTPYKQDVEIIRDPLFSGVVDVFPECFSVACRGRHEDILTLLFEHENFEPVPAMLRESIGFSQFKIAERLILTGRINLGFSKNLILENLSQMCKNTGEEKDGNRENIIIHHLIVLVLKIGKNDVDATCLIPYAVERNDPDFIYYLLTEEPISKKLEVTAFENSLLKWALGSSTRDVRLVELILSKIISFNFRYLSADELRGRSTSIWERNMTLDVSEVFGDGGELPPENLRGRNCPFIEVEISNVREMQERLRDIVKDIESDHRFLEKKVGEVVRELRFRDETSICVSLFNFFISILKEKGEETNILREEVRLLKLENQQMKKKMNDLEENFKLLMEQMNKK